MSLRRIRWKELGSGQKPDRLPQTFCCFPRDSFNRRVVTERLYFSDVAFMFWVQFKLFRSTPTLKRRRMSNHPAENYLRAAPKVIERACKGVHKLGGRIGKPHEPLSQFEKVITSVIADASLCATGFLMGRGSIHGWEILVGFAVPLYMLWLVASAPGDVPREPEESGS